MLLGLFAFLRAGEFTMQVKKFDPYTHLTPRDIEVDDLSNPTMLNIRIKKSKTSVERVWIYMLERLVMNYAQ